MPSSTLLHLRQGEWSQWFSSVDKTSRSRHLKGFLEFQECPSGRFHDPGGQRASEAPVAFQPNRFRETHHRGADRPYQILSLRDFALGLRKAHGSLYHNSRGFYSLFCTDRKSTRLNS